MNRPEFYPGWKMTRAQHQAYWRLLSQVNAVQNVTSAEERESMRKLIHDRAFGRAVSAKDIDHLKMFDAFKGACLAMIQPANWEAQLHQVDQPLIRLRHACRQLADEPYIQALVQGPRFKKQSLDDLDERELTDLRNTLAARASARRRKQEPLAAATNEPF
jgi:hypothetical protein